MAGTFGVGNIGKSQVRIEIFGRGAAVIENKTQYIAGRQNAGAHLHFEIRRDGQQINPENFLGRSFALQDVAPEADGSWDAPAFFASAPVAFGPFRTLTPAFQP